MIARHERQKLKNKKAQVLYWGFARGVGVKMPIKIKIQNSGPTKVTVRIGRPAWQQFLVY
jgi:hypothetical protein